MALYKVLNHRVLPRVERPHQRQAGLHRALLLPGSPLSLLFGKFLLMLLGGGRVFVSLGLLGVGGRR